MILSQFVRSLIELGKTGHQNVAYGVVATLVNITNSYDKQEIGKSSFFRDLVE